MIEFNQGEVLTASKMNSLARQSQGTSQQGMLHRSPTGIVSGTKDTRNYIDQYRPFDVYRHTATKLRVRAGAWEHYFGITRTVTNMAIDSGTSANPEDYKTISPTLSASTAYTVYLEFYSTGLTLEAKCVAASSFPADATDYYRYILARFTTTSDGSIPTIQPEVGHIIFQGGGSRWDLINDAAQDVDMLSDTDNTDSLDVGLYNQRWTDINAYAAGDIVLTAAYDSSTTIYGDVLYLGDNGLYGTGVSLFSEYDDITLSTASGVGGDVDIIPNSDCLIAPGGNIIMALPTSSTGLPAGALWNNSGVVSIV